MLDTTRNQFWCDKITLTPADARRIIEENTSNRDLSKIMIRKMASDMATGKWKFNGESIKFAAGGRLVDGQHRLHAIVDAGVTLDLVACGGFDPAIFDTIDTGKKRGLKDLMKIAGVKNYVLASSSTSWLIRLHTANPLTARTHDLTPAEQLAFYYQHEHETQWAILLFARLRAGTGRDRNAIPMIACPPGLAVALAVMFHTIDHDFTERFFRLWNDASERPDLVTTSPAAILAEALSSRMSNLARIGGRFHDSDRLLMIVTTWNTWIRGEKLRSSDLARISVQNKSTPTKWPGILGPKIGDPIIAQPDPAQATWLTEQVKNREAVWARDDAE